MRRLSSDEVLNDVISKKTTKAIINEDLIPFEKLSFKKDFISVFDKDFSKTFSKKIKKLFKEERIVDKKIEVKIVSENNYGKLDSTIKVKINPVNEEDNLLADIEITFSHEANTYGIAGCLHIYDYTASDNEALLIKILRKFFSSASAFFLRNLNIFEVNYAKNGLFIDDQITFFVNVIEYTEANKEENTTDIVRFKSNYIKRIFGDVFSFKDIYSTYCFDKVKDIFEACFEESKIRFSKSNITDFFDNKVKMVLYSKEYADEVTLCLNFDKNLEKDFNIEHIKFIFYLSKKQYDVYFEGRLRNHLIKDYYFCEKKELCESKLNFCIEFLHEMLYDMVKAWSYNVAVNKASDDINLPELEKCELNELIYQVKIGNDEK